MRLKELRVKRNLYQKDVASMLGIDRTTYAKYETGDSEPNFGTLLKIADIFDVSTDYLLGRVHKENPALVVEAGPSAKHRELVELFDAASPDLQSAAIAVLRSSDGRIIEVEPAQIKGAELEAVLVRGAEPVQVKGLETMRVKGAEPIRIRRQGTGQVKRWGNAHSKKGFGTGRGRK